MRKGISVLLGGCMLLALSASAFAAESEGSELIITEERLYEIPEDQGVFYYIKVENPTDHPVACGNVIISMYNESGELLKDSKLTTKPFNAVIQPGDFLYLHANAGNAIFKEADIASYETVIEVPKSTVEIAQHPTEGTLVFDEKTGDLKCIEVAITNDTDEIIYDWYTDIGVYDENDELMYASSVLFDIGLSPNSTMYRKYFVDFTLEKYLAETGVKAARVVTTGHTAVH